MTDVGRRFIATRVLELDITLDDLDVADQEEAGETAYESAVIIAGSTPTDGWTVVCDEIEERT